MRRTVDVQAIGMLCSLFHDGAWASQKPPPGISSGQPGCLQGSVGRFATIPDKRFGEQASILNDGHAHEDGHTSGGFTTEQTPSGRRNTQPSIARRAWRQQTRMV